MTCTGMPFSRAAFVAAALTPETTGKIYNVGGTEPITLSDLAKIMIETNGGGTMKQKPFPLAQRRIDIGDYYTDDRAFRSLTGWAPRVNVETGVARTLAFYKAHRQHYL